MNQQAPPSCNPKAALKQQGQILLGLLAGLAFTAGYISLIALFAWSVENSETARNVSVFTIKNILLPALIITLILGVAGPILYAVFKPSIHLGLYWLQRRQARRRQS